MRQARAYKNVQLDAKEGRGGGGRHGPGSCSSWCLSRPLLHRAARGLSYSPQTYHPETRMYSVNLHESQKPQKIEN